MIRRQDWLWLGRWMKTRRQDRGTEQPKKLSVWWGERSLGVALRSISESTLKTTQIHESGASPQILHVSGASTLGPLFQWSLNFTLAFLESPERKKHLLLKSGWFYPGWKAGVHFDLFLVVWAFINVNHICIGYTWYFCRSYVSTPSSSRQTLTQQWQRCPGTGSSQPHGVVTTDRSKGNLPKVTQLHYVVEQRGIWTQPSSSDLNHHTLQASQ